MTDPSPPQGERESALEDWRWARVVNLTGDVPMADVAAMIRAGDMLAAALRTQPARNQEGG